MEMCSRHADHVMTGSPYKRAPTKTRSVVIQAALGKVHQPAVWTHKAVRADKAVPAVLVVQAVLVAKAAQAVLVVLVAKAVLVGLVAKAAQAVLVAKVAPAVCKPNV